MIDEQATIGGIIEALKAGNKAEAIAKEIDGISQKPFLNALKAAGYKYSNKAPQGWHFVAEGVEPLNQSIFDFVKRSSSPMKSNSQAIHQQFTEGNRSITQSNTPVTSNSPMIHQQFTQDEMKMIREMLKSWQEAIPVPMVKSSESLHERIKNLPQDEKTRKTIVIDKNIGELFDKFCEIERVNKSDVLHLALADFLNKK